MLEQMWLKEVPCIINLFDLDCADNTLPLPLFLHLRWNHYIGFYFNQIKEFFMAYLPFPIRQSEFWVQIQNQNKELVGTEIVNHLLEFYCPHEAALHLRCHFRRVKPKQTIDLKKHYKNNLKASTCIRFGKMGSSIITVEMSVNNIEDMFNNFKNNEWKSFRGEVDQQSINLGFDYITMQDKKIDKIPLRLVKNEITIERSVEKNRTLKEFMDEFMGKDQPEQESQVKLKLHGILIKQDNMSFAYLQKFCHPDGFLYFTF